MLHLHPAVIVGDMFKVLQWSTASTSLYLLSLKVHATSKKKDDFSVRVSDLSLYSLPNYESKFVEEPQSALEEGISRLRKAMTPYASWFQGTYSKMKPTVDDAIQQGTASCDNLRNSPPEFLKRLMTIGFSGVLGYVLARSSKLKKLVYPFCFMGITSAIYYPQEAFNIVLLSGEKLFECCLAFIKIPDSWKTVQEEEGEMKPSS